MNSDGPFFSRIPDFFTLATELLINRSALTPGTALNMFYISVVFLGHLALEPSFKFKGICDPATLNFLHNFLPVAQQAAFCSTTASLNCLFSEAA